MSPFFFAPEFVPVNITPGNVGRKLHWSIMLSFHDEKNAPHFSIVHRMEQEPTVQPVYGDGGNHVQLRRGSFDTLLPASAPGAFVLERKLYPRDSAGRHTSQASPAPSWPCSYILPFHHLVPIVVGPKTNTECSRYLHAAAGFPLVPSRIPFSPSTKRFCCHQLLQPRGFSVTEVFNVSLIPLFRRLRVRLPSSQVLRRGPFGEEDEDDDDDDGSTDAGSSSS